MTEDTRPGPMTPSTPAHASRGEGETLREAVARAIYDAMRENDPEGRDRPWVPGGNSRKQDEARRRADDALAASPAPREEGLDVDRLEGALPLATIGYEPGDVSPHDAAVQIAGDYGTCNCAFYGNASRCSVHTQADYDAQVAARTSPPAVDVERLATALFYRYGSGKGLYQTPDEWQADAASVVALLATPSQDTPAREEQSVNEAFAADLGAHFEDTPAREEGA